MSKYDQNMPDRHLHLQDSYPHNTTPLMTPEPRDQHYSVSVCAFTRGCVCSFKKVRWLSVVPISTRMLFPVNQGGAALRHVIINEEHLVLPFPAAIHNHLAHSCFWGVGGVFNKSDKFFFIVTPVWGDINPHIE